MSKMQPPVLLPNNFNISLSVGENGIFTSWEVTYICFIIMGDVFVFS